MVVNKYFRIFRSDSQNICIERYREITNLKTKETRVEWVNEGVYFGNFQQALEWVRKESIKDGIDVCKDLEDLITFCKEYQVEIVKDEN